MPCSQVKIKGADEHTHVWRIILRQSDFLLFLIRDLSPTETEILGNFVEMFLFFLFFFILCLTFLFRSSLYRQDRFAVLYLCIWAIFTHPKTVDLFHRDIAIQGTPPFRGHKNWSRKNVHIIFASVSSIEETPGERGTFSGSRNLGLTSIQGTP